MISTEQLYQFFQASIGGVINARQRPRPRLPSPLSAFAAAAAASFLLLFATSSSSSLLFLLLLPPLVLLSSSFHLLLPLPPSPLTLSHSPPFHISSQPLLHITDTCRP
eukprot:789284-Rhodomonas_salina.2